MLHRYKIALITLRTHKNAILEYSSGLIFYLATSNFLISLYEMERNTILFNLC